MSPENVSRPCGGFVLIEGRDTPCGSATKHPSGLCYMHRQDEATQAAPGLPRGESQRQWTRHTEVGVAPMTPPENAAVEAPTLDDRTRAIFGHIWRMARDDELRPDSCTTCADAKRLLGDEAER